MRKTYVHVSIDDAIRLIRPGAQYSFVHESGGGAFIQWNDPRPMPTLDEIYATMEKIRAFEDSVDCIEL